MSSHPSTRTTGWDSLPAVYYFQSSIVNLEIENDEGKVPATLQSSKYPELSLSELEMDEIHWDVV